MALTLKTPPAVEPVSLIDLKQALRVDYSDEDALLTSYIAAAREYCENFQNRAYITQVWELTLDDFPRGVIEIPKGQLQSVNSLTYRDAAGVIRTLEQNVDYIYSTKGILGRVSPAYGKLWPCFIPYPLEAVTIEFTCGYGNTAADVPENTKQAIKLLAAHWFTNREGVLVGTISRELEFAVSALLWMNRIVPV